MREIAWVITNGYNGGGHLTYWDGRQAGERAVFVIDNREAIRFARQEDAERAKHWLLPPNVGAVEEHVWLEPQHG